MPARREDFVERVARCIAKTRADLGLTQEALAARLDIASKNVQRIESGKQNLTLRSVERIAQALHVRPESFFVAEAASRPAKPPTPLTLLAAAGYETRVVTRSGRKPAGAVPVMSLRAAAGALAGGSRAVDVLGWVVLARRGAPPEGQFVAQVQGDSMAPRVADGAICLFGRPTSSALKGRIVLVEHTTLQDSDLGGPYALKRARIAEKRRGAKMRVLLESTNPRHPTIAIDLDDPDELRVIAELIKVLA